MSVGSIFSAQDITNLAVRMAFAFPAFLEKVRRDRKRQSLSTEFQRVVDVYVMSGLFIAVYLSQVSRQTPLMCQT